MDKKSSSKLGWLAAGTVAILLSLIAISAATYVGNDGKGTYLLFDNLVWIPLLVAMAGLVSAALIRRPGDRIEGDRVLRHDGVARLTHWASAFGCIVLLVTGVMLGFLFIPRFASSADQVAVMFNLHFVGALFFIYGVCLWVGNQFVDTNRMKGHLPDQGIVHEVKSAVLHYTTMLGLTKVHVETPKYHHSGRLAGLFIIAASALVLISGFVKVFARVIDFAPATMELMNLAHGVGSLLMLLLIPFHAVLAGLAPWAWYGLRSMFTGYISVEDAKHHHEIWYRELKQKEKK